MALKQLSFADIAKLETAIKSGNLKGPAAKVIALLYGLNGQPALEIWQVAGRLNRTVQDIETMVSAALSALIPDTPVPEVQEQKPAQSALVCGKTDSSAPAVVKAPKPPKAKKPIGWRLAALKAGERLERYIDKRGGKRLRKVSPPKKKSSYQRRVFSREEAFATLKAIAKFYQVSADAILSSSNYKTEVVFARAVVIYVLHELEYLSFQEIGEILGMSQSGVTSSFLKISEARPSITLGMCTFVPPKKKRANKSRS